VTSVALERARAAQPAGFTPTFEEELDERRARGELSLAVRNVLVELERWRLEAPRHAAWIAAGARPIHSEAEHVDTFGMAYVMPDRKRRRT
jgi:hypothetical protein